jgi:LacI family transcriptional regulator
VTTIKDVAERAGVSIKTVSRVLNNEPHVRGEVQERVRAAALDLDYKPNRAASRLAGGRSFLIAHLYDNPNPSYIAALHIGAARRCRELGYHLVVEPVNSQDKDLLGLVQRLFATIAPDGILLSPPLSENTEFVESVRKLGGRIALISATHGDGLTHISTDERGASKAIMAHLLGLGHRRIGFVRGHPQHFGATLRYDGYCQSMTEAGLALEPDLVAQGYFDLQSGLEATRALLALPERPTAIFASNDEMAVGALIAARELGLRVPDDLSVIGFDDTPISRLISPALTTVRQPLEAMGAAGVEAIVAPAHAPVDYLEFEIILRDSCTAPRG